MARYNPKETEPKWRKAWDDAQVFRAEIDPARGIAGAVAIASHHNDEIAAWARVAEAATAIAS